MLLRIRTDFSTAPGPRACEEGKHSGEEFRKTVLAPRVRDAIDRKESLLIDLDGTAGYGTSFLEESFGGLIREEGFRLAQLKETIRYKSDDEPELIEEIEAYMSSAEAAVGKERS